MPLIAEIYLTEDNLRKTIEIDRDSDVTYSQGQVQIRGLNEVLIYPEGAWKRVRLFEGGRPNVD